MMYNIYAFVSEFIDYPGFIKVQHSDGNLFDQDTRDTLEEYKSYWIIALDIIVLSVTIIGTIWSVATNSGKMFDI